MNLFELIIWNVDTQNDFVEPDGKLYVQDAELLKSTWKKITDFAKDQQIKVVNSADHHFPDAFEISDTPD